MRKISLFLSALSAVILISTGLLTVVDITARTAFHTVIPDLPEIRQLLTVIAIAFCFPIVALKGSHFRAKLGIVQRNIGEKTYRDISDSVLLLFYGMLTASFILIADDMHVASAKTFLLDWKIHVFWYIATTGVIILFVVQCTKFKSGIEALSTDRKTMQRYCKTIFCVLLSVGPFLYISIIGSVKMEAFVALASVISIVLIALLGVPFSASIFLASIIGIAFYFDSISLAFTSYSSGVMSFLGGSSLATIPLYILIGSVLGGMGVAEELYLLCRKITANKRGSAGLATILGCAGFSAATGSSVATTISIGKIAYPMMRQSGESAEISAGCIAAGGSLGILVPPSIMVIIYASLTGESVAKLFTASILPALISVILYGVVVGVFCIKDTHTNNFSNYETNYAKLIVLTLVVLSVLGGIYSGYATPTEAASIGLFVSIIGRAWVCRREDGNGMLNTFFDASEATGQLYLLLLGAIAFSTLLSITNIPVDLFSFVQAAELSSFQTIVAIIFMYILLGTIMDPITMLVVTIPVLLPTLTQLSIDLVWWGILTIVICELAMITPPFGLNLFAIKTVVDQDISWNQIYRGVIPFAIADIVRLVIIMTIPSFIMYIPNWLH